MLTHKVFLTQTDTTIGFVSQDAERLTQIKQRPPYKHYITAVNSQKTLQRFTRIPSRHRNRVRRSQKTTFIMPDGHSYRLIRDRHHLLLMNRLGWAYTTSANLSGNAYDETFAKRSADVIIAPLEATKQASTIYKLGKTTLKRIR
ncbi:Sua5 YciO YrdC YwlC family protein [Sulfurovum mangrovi]|uniref:Sua5 YciO YrdC YwlC family protein n=1 Tax=Sulfurovum mangrovi TaxID=2893889 RepID=UPI001E474379|nr:Sua5 YciO YrdC YwlC family protein [Sulfurovum mangrovi]UFH60450.1 Sua5 YciO YrdC YwlC family protein [Sulfurovum mangrovi]